MEVTAIFEQDEGWWIGWTEELRGPVGQGRTMDECRESLLEAIEATLAFMHEEAERRIDGRPVVRERMRVAASRGGKSRRARAGAEGRARRR